MKNPTTEALLYRIWAHCHPIEWDCTIAECAEAIDEPMRRVKAVVQHRGWTHRFRKARVDGYHAAPHRLQSPNDPATHDW